MAFIYGLRAKEDDRYFYVGSTKFEIEHRLSQHLYEVVNGTHMNPYFLNKAKKIGIDNIVSEVLEEVDEALRYTKETDWIQRLFDADHPLVNFCHNPDRYHRLKTEAIDPYTPHKLLMGYLELDTPAPSALDPRNQRIVNGLHQVACDTIKHMLNKFPDEAWRDLLYAAREAKRTDTKAARIHLGISRLLERHRSS